MLEPGNFSIIFSPCFLPAFSSVLYSKRDITDIFFILKDAKHLYFLNIWSKVRNFFWKFMENTCFFFDKNISFILRVPSYQNIWIIISKGQGFQERKRVLLTHDLWGGGHLVKSEKNMKDGKLKNFIIFLKRHTWRNIPLLASIWKKYITKVWA